jgi:predicted HD phosphohydrolase
MADEQSRQALRLLTASRDDSTFGYAVNNYRHCLQSATLVMEAGLDEETIVVALLHDIGFIACPDSHGEFAAALLGAYISEANLWMLRHHAAFQNHHVHDCPGIDRDARERWREHEHFQWTAEFVERYDQGAICAAFTTAPIEAFEPMVQRLFARTPRRRK